MNNQFVIFVTFHILQGKVATFYELNQNRQTWHRDSPSRYVAHQCILGQRVKGQGHRVKKCKKSRRNSAVLRRLAPL